MSEITLFVYNNTTRLINMGAKLPILPGENKLTKKQAAFLMSFDLDAYVKGKNPWLTISDVRIVQEEEDESAANEASRKLKEFVEEGGEKVIDATDGIPEEEGNDLAAKIAARTGGR